MTPQERAATLVHPNVANVRQYRGTGSLDMGRIHAVSRWVGDRLERERLARIAATQGSTAGRASLPRRALGTTDRGDLPAPVRGCGFLGCETPAAYVIKPPYSEAVFRCSVHAPDTYDYYSFFANRQTTGVRIEALS